MIDSRKIRGLSMPAWFATAPTIVPSTMSEDLVWFATAPTIVPSTVSEDLQQPRVSFVSELLHSGIVIGKTRMMANLTSLQGHPLQVAQTAVALEKLR